MTPILNYLFCRHTSLYPDLNSSSRSSGSQNLRRHQSKDDPITTNCLSRVWSQQTLFANKEGVSRKITAIKSRVDIEIFGSDPGTETLPDSYRGVKTVRLWVRLPLCRWTPLEKRTDSICVLPLTFVREFRFQTSVVCQ